MNKLLVVMNWIVRWAKALGPYFLLELLCPGGTVMALVLWQIRKRTKGQVFWHA